MTRRLKTRGFTLVEMLLATTLAAILMGGVLTATVALARDRRWMEARTTLDASSGVMEIIRRDLANAAVFVGARDANGFEMVGFGGIDGKALVGNQRLVRVTYRVMRTAKPDAAGVLVRGQAYLDDAIRPDRWNEVVAAGVKRVVITAISDDGDAVRLGDEVAERLSGSNGRGGALMARRVPSRLRVRVEFVDRVVDREMVLR